MNDIICRLTALFLMYSIGLQAQGQTELISLGFWNVENLFDTQNDSLVFDDERTPKGTYRWNAKRYRKKIKKLAHIVSGMDELKKAVPDILGICEVENLEVLQDLNRALNSPYEIIHEDSPDRRGIDVALFYNPRKVLIQSYRYRSLKLYNDEQTRIYTRDQLLVEALVSREQIYLIINHWPSRSGGELRSKPNRIRAAELNLKLIDSIRKFNKNARIISMGDFNDNPSSDSFKKTLKTSGNRYLSSKTKLFNPMEALFKKGIGTLAYRGQWHLFDQFYITKNLLNESTIRFYKAFVIKPQVMINLKGNYKGYPKRTYSGTNYLGGYSDHFPILMYLYKKRERKAPL